jgi:hypothetical protein
MNLNDFAKGLRAAANELKAEAPKLVRIAAMDSMAIVERRIKEEGVKGASYKSKGKVKYFQGGLGSGAFKNYATHGKVDLTLTNRMWNSLSVLGVQTIREGVYQAQVGTTDKEGDAKVIANLKRYGDFLQPTEQEQSELLEDTKLAILDILNKHLT